MNRKNAISRGFSFLRGHRDKKEKGELGREENVNYSD